MIRSKVVFIVLLMLSFNILHDSFISFVEKNRHAQTVQCMNDDVPSSECKEFNKIHSMFHFIAIVTTDQEILVHLPKIVSISYFLTQYTPPFLKTSYKPPIA